MSQSSVVITSHVNVNTLVITGWCARAFEMDLCDTLRGAPKVSGNGQHTDGRVMFKKKSYKSNTHVVPVVLFIHLLAQPRAARVEHQGHRLLLRQEAVHVEILGHRANTSFESSARVRGGSGPRRDLPTGRLGDFQNKRRSRHLLLRFCFLFFFCV